MLLTIVRLNESEWGNHSSSYRMDLGCGFLGGYEPNDLMSSPDDHSSMHFEHMASRATHNKN